MKIIGGLVCFRISDFWHRISHPADKRIVFLLHDAQQLLPHRHFFRQNPEITWSLFYGHNNLYQYHKGLNKPLCPENTVVQRSLSPCAWFSLVSVDTTLLCTAIVLQITASIFVCFRSGYQTACTSFSYTRIFLTQIAVETFIPATKPAFQKSQNSGSCQKQSHASLSDILRKHLRVLTLPPERHRPIQVLPAKRFDHTTSFMHGEQLNYILLYCTNI